MMLNKAGKKIMKREMRAQQLHQFQQTAQAVPVFRKSTVHLWVLSVLNGWQNRARKARYAGG